MHINKLQLTDIHYNAEFECFETKVTIQEGNEVFVYPVHINAPMTAEFAVIARGLTEKARQAHRAPVKGMHLHFPAVTFDNALDPRPRHAA